MMASLSFYKPQFFIAFCFHQPSQFLLILCNWWPWLSAEICLYDIPTMGSNSWKGSKKLRQWGTEAVLASPSPLLAQPPCQVFPWRRLIMYWLRAHRHWSQAAQVQTLGLPPFPSCVTLGKIPFFFFFFCWLGPHPWHMKAPRLGVESQVLPAYTTATAMQDLSHICDLHHSFWQHRILNPLSEARDWTCHLLVPSQIHLHYTTRGTPMDRILNIFKIQFPHLKNGHSNSTLLHTLNETVYVEQLT